MFTTGISNNTNNIGILVDQHQQSSLTNNSNIQINQPYVISAASTQPSCIVIGCKNGSGGCSLQQTVKYYQVPLVQQHNNQIARQWYINTLREDLLDLIDSNQNQQAPIHYVCIEHFDEESFIIANTSEIQQPSQDDIVMLLKEDAVPSLFEIEVFQKMIAHQEQISINQQQKQLIQQQKQQQQQQYQRTSLLSNLILANNQPAQQPKQTTSTITITQNNLNTVKRTRIDPDTRAALIQRVPKAVKRTALISTQTHTNNSFNNSNTSTLPTKLQKAVKHTGPRPQAQVSQGLISNNNVTIINDIAPSPNLINKNSNTVPQTVITSLQSANATSTIKVQKAVKHTSASSMVLKDFLPPPIMQSTKRPTSVNKAIKHTGGGSNAYYQSNKQIHPQQQQTQLNKITLVNTNTHQPLTQLNLNSNNVDLINNANNNNLKNTQSNLLTSNLNKPSTTNNKITITTTYVYKRVMNPPEIDLDLECEEEEIIYIVESPKQPTPVPSPELIEIDESTLVVNQEENLNKKVEEEVKSSENLVLQEPTSKLIQNGKLENDKLQDTRIKSKKEETRINKEDSAKSLETTSEESKKLESNKNQENEKMAPIIAPDATNCKINSNKLGEKLQDALIKLNESSSVDNLVNKPLEKFNKVEKQQLNKSKTDSESNINDLNSSSTINVDKKQIANNKKEKLNKKDLDQSSNSISIGAISNYSNILSKFYSRRPGALTAALKATNTTNNKKFKSSNSTLPPDLRNGNYPAKCNVCNLILENNIELTSHICSHLESNDGTNDAYISPFDAVTTTCGVCDTTFSQPFDLIKHLDLKHMKQLGEYKCRICEKQHGKLSELLAHLNQAHSHQEMPYRCDACGFRTSFYADAIYHIKKEHTCTLRHFCPYCLKSLVLPYNSKLGHVQCNQFYSHLVTHFNKHENNVLMPSKCKHCHKCILHVRYMKEHLMYDHNCNENNTTSASKLSLDSSDTESKKSKTKEATKSAKQQNMLSRHSIATSSIQSVKEDSSKSKYNLRKRRRSTLSDDNSELKIDEDVSSLDNNDVIINENEDYDADADDNEIDEEKEKFKDAKEDENGMNKNEETKEDVSNKTKSEDIYDFESNESNTKKPQPQTQPAAQEIKPPPKTRGRKPSLATQLKNNQPHSPNLTKKIIKTESDETLEPTEQDSNTVELQSQLISARKPKALKQTNIKKQSKTGQTRRTYRNRSVSHDLDDDNLDYSASSPSAIISATLVGNIRFNCMKSEFKCVECGDANLKQHYRNDYTCHQCYYNTNCSKSFEYHLHGHLDKKRMALWNKVIKNSFEEYTCPCGFKLNAALDNKSNADTGNKVAAHLLNCEYKYCRFNLIENESEDGSKLEDEEKEINPDDNVEESKELDGQNDENKMELIAESN